MAGHAYASRAAGGPGLVGVGLAADSGGGDSHEEEDEHGGGDEE